jgi:hypothetical protein
VRALVRVENRARQVLSDVELVRGDLEDASSFGRALHDSRAPAQPTSQTKKTLWLWAAGTGPDPEVCWRGYLRRFDLEHRPVSQEHPRLDHPIGAHPEQADRWTWLILAANTQLHLARGSSRISGCPGNDDQTQPAQPASGEGFADLLHP